MVRVCAVRLMDDNSVVVLLLVFLWIDFKCVSFSIFYFVCCCRFRDFSYWRNTITNNNNNNISGNKSETAYSFSCPAIARCLFIQQTKEKKIGRKNGEKTCWGFDVISDFFKKFFCTKIVMVFYYFSLLLIPCFLTGVFCH